MEGGGRAGRGRSQHVLNCLYPKPNAIFKLICFPWAGSGSTYFANWGKKINDLVEVHAVRFAGRESRIQEPVVNDIYQLADEIIYALLPVIRDKSFAFLGHSFGAYVAFVTALRLKEQHRLEPQHLFLSSITAPYSEHRPTVPELDKVSLEDFKQFLVLCGGTPNHITNDLDLLKENMALLKKDLNILKNFIYDKPSGAVLSCDLTCLTGSEDIEKDVEDWKIVTSGTFDVHILPGHHFYIMEPANENFIHNYIVKSLEFTLLSGF
uniref:S-acyl fatty acid synthase thioesterase, medium chain n=1 Tax=Jaculus jaculus TaxID=51337 RepID=A0A8C5NVS3_JACJA